MPDPKPPTLATRLAASLAAQDLEGLDAIDPRLAAAPPPPEAPPLPLMLPEGTTEEQRQTAQAAQAVKALLTEPALAELRQAMVAMRRAYAVAHRQLGVALDGRPNLPDLTKDFFVQLAMFEAAQPFDEVTMMDAIPRTVIPWLARTVDAHIAADRDEARRATEAVETARRAARIPLGFKVDAFAPDATLGRDRGLVLVGWDPALRWLVDQVVTHALAARDGGLLTVLRLSADPPRRAAQQRQLVTLGRIQWEGCCNANDGLAKVIGRHAMDVLSATPDLLICDDLTRAYTRSYVGRARGAVAGEAHQKFERWCKLAGCGFLGLLPTPGPEPVDHRAPEYEQLRVHATFRPVVVQEGLEGLDPGSLRLSVGAAQFDVPRAVLEAYRPSGLVLTS